jgi:hypothetical protein
VNWADIFMTYVTANKDVYGSWPLSELGQGAVLDQLTNLELILQVTTENLLQYPAKNPYAQ